jgi:hypothetical protein
MNAISQHLTKPQGEEQAIREAATHAGQAFWGLTGPPGASCRECRFWSCPPADMGFRKRPDYPATYKRALDGTLKNRRCRKYPRLQGGIWGEAVPHYAHACKYFERAAKPAPLHGWNTPKHLKPPKPKRERKRKAK